MPACSLAPADRRAQVRRVGNDLLRHHGRQRHYTVQQVQDANRRQGIDLDFACWSHAVFNSHTDFDAHHRAMGEVCDYAAMKAEMLASVSDSAEAATRLAEPGWFDIDLSWLEFPDIDWSLFDVFDL